MTAPDHHCARTALAPLPKSMDEDLRHRSRYWHSRYYLARLLLTLLAARADDEHHIAEVRLEELRDEAGCGLGLICTTLLDLRDLGAIRECRNCPEDVCEFEILIGLRAADFCASCSSSGVRAALEYGRSLAEMSMDDVMCRELTAGHPLADIVDVRRSEASEWNSASLW